MPEKYSHSAKDTSATIRFGAKLWISADKRRNNMDVPEYKDIVIAMTSLKYMSDTFEKHRTDYAQTSAPQRKQNNVEMALPLLK